MSIPAKSLRIMAARSIAALFLFVCVHIAAQKAASPAPKFQYNTAASVLSLSYAEASRHGTARIEGTVTLSYEWGLIVHDRTAAVYVDIAGKYAPGARLIVSGHVEPGRFSPQISSPTIRRLGSGPLPAPMPVSFQKLSSGEEDSQYVSVEGTVLSVGRRADMPPLGHTTLSIAVPDGRVEAILAPSVERMANSLIDAKVRVVGTAMNRKNDNMQTTGVVLAVSDTGAIRVLSPGPKDVFAVPLRPIGDLLRYRSNTDYFHRVRIAGTLTYYEPGKQLVLQDNNEAIEILTTDRLSLQLGDRVEAVGFPAPDASGPILRDAAVRYLSHGSPPVPLAISLQDAFSSKYRFCLVSLEMHLVRVMEEPSRVLLLLEHNNRITTAELALHRTTPVPHFVSGGTVRVSGVNMLTGETGLIYVGGAIRSSLLLRNSADVAVISPAPWWTTARLSYLAAALAALLVGFLILLTYVQLKRWKMETVLQERERLAHDVHDTLAQSFAGIGFQLQVIHRAAAAADSQLEHHIDVARDLVQFSHREARRSFASISTEECEDGDLLSALRAVTETLATTGLIEFDIRTSGQPRALPGLLNTQLLRIGQEAISNAVRHAEPKHVTTAVTYTADSVRLEIVDDGRGFLLRGDLLGFGIRGMRKRAAQIGGDLAIVSNPGQGTSVSVVVAAVGPDGWMASTLRKLQSFFRKTSESNTYAGG